MKETKPTFSIITVVFNGADLLEGTLKSVKMQTYTNYEYIVIDGGSTDGTLDTIQNNQHHLTTWISEKDKGIYDAMNKAFALAKGDFLLFLNSGDRLFDTEVLANLAKHITPKTAILYGETMLVNEQREHIGTRSALTPQRLPKQLNWQSMRFGMVVCHQAFLVRRELPPPQYIEKNLAADIDWVINCLKKSRETVNTHIIISEYLMGGTSKKRHQQSLWDRYDILKKHFGFFPNVFAHAYIVARAAWFKLFHKNSY